MCRPLSYQCAHLSPFPEQQFRQGYWRSFSERSLCLRVYTTNRQRRSLARGALEPIPCNNEKEASTYAGVPVSRPTLTRPRMQSRRRPPRDTKSPADRRCRPAGRESPRFRRRRSERRSALRSCRDHHLLADSCSGEPSRGDVEQPARRPCLHLRQRKPHCDASYSCERAGRLWFRGSPTHAGSNVHHTFSTLASASTSAGSVRSGRFVGFVLSSWSTGARGLVFCRCRVRSIVIYSVIPRFAGLSLLSSLTLTLSSGEVSASVHLAVNPMALMHPQLVFLHVQALQRSGCNFM